MSAFDPAADVQERCARCACALTHQAAFTLGGRRRCLPCTLRYGPLLRRSGATALVVGTILVAINQGTVFLDGTWPASLLWKIPLTYAVPFCVATWGALSNSRSLGIDSPAKEALA